MRYALVMGGWCLLFSCSAVVAGWGKPGAPASLHAVSASCAEARLAWDASTGAASYVVETLGTNQQWTALPATPADPVATIPVAQFATYTFRVRAKGADGAISEPSNEITVGPPPVGFHVAAPSVKALKDPAQFAPKMVMALDYNGDPMFAYLLQDPNSDQDFSDNELYFVGWNRAKYKWNAAVKVDTVGEININGTLVGFSLAADGSNHRLGIAYMVGMKQLRLALSDDAGATWKTQTVQQDAEGTFEEPSLALANGHVYLAYFHANDGVRYREGAENDPPDKWSSELAPPLAGAGNIRADGMSLALDSAGKPAVAYLLGPTDEYNVTIAFWRPGHNAVKAADSNRNSSDDPEARLIFQGIQPRLILFMKRDDKFYNTADQIWVVRAKDDGANWEPPVALPNDGGNSMGFPIALSIATSGKAAATAHVNGGNNDRTRCGQPKLIQSTDFAHWSICAAGGTNGSPEEEVKNPQLTFAGNDKLYMGYVVTKGTKIGAGILLWREP